MEWQEAVLASAVPEWPNVAVFRDVQDRRERGWQKAETLIDRAEMLRPTSRKELDTIYLASLTVLAWDENDFQTVMEEIRARGAVIMAVDEGLTIDSETLLKDILQIWKQARKKKRISNAQLKGGQVSADRKKAKAAEGVERIRPYWGMPASEYPTLMLRQMAGSVEVPMAYNTIVAHIGYGREIAHKRYLAVLRRKITLAEKAMADAD